MSRDRHLQHGWRRPSVSKENHLIAVAMITETIRDEEESIRMLVPSATMDRAMSRYAICILQSLQRRLQSEVNAPRRKGGDK